MMHTTKMTATGCDTIERKRMIGKMDHVIGWKLLNHPEKPQKSANKKQDELHRFIFFPAKSVWVC